MGFVLGMGAILVCVAVYLGFFIKRIIVELCPSMDKKRLYILISISLMIIIGLCYFGRLSAFMALIYIFVLGVVVQLCHFLFSKVTRNEKLKARINHYYNLGFVPIVITAIIMVVGYFNMIDIVETDYQVETNKLKQGETIKIALISDTHLSNALSGKDLKKYIKEIEEKNPDILILAGDIFDENTTRKDMEEGCKILGSTNTKEGIYYIYGNHDKSTYGGNSNYSVQSMEKSLIDSGIIVLKDQSVEMEDCYLIGRMDFSGDLKGNNRLPLQELMENIDMSKYVIDLDHQPRDSKEAEKLGIDLQLSGHTHGGQIWPASILNEIFGFNEYEYGINRIGNYHIIVSSGLSGWGFPIRTEPHSEYVMVTIIGKD